MSSFMYLLGGSTVFGRGLRTVITACLELILCLGWVCKGNENSDHSIARVGAFSIGVNFILAILSSDCGAYKSCCTF